MWIDPGEVAVCFGDEGTWCPLYKHDSDGHVHQEYSDGEETASSLSSDDDVNSLTQNVKALNVTDAHVEPATSRTSNTNDQQASGTDFYAYPSVVNDWNEQANVFWPQQLGTSDSSFMSQLRDSFFQSH